MTRRREKAGFTVITLGGVEGVLPDVMATRVLKMEMALQRIRQLTFDSPRSDGKVAKMLADEALA